jgi:hypothetical protein
MPDHIVLPIRFAGHAGTNPAILQLHFGVWQHEVKAQFNDHLRQDTIGLPAYYKTLVTIPDGLPYEMYVDGTNLHLGPVIAFLVDNKELTPKLLDKYRGYFLNYNSIKGLIYMCSVNGINPKKKTVQGYYYNPQSEGGGDPWIKGNFPYPGAIYRRTRVNKNKLYDDLIVSAERKIFNPYYLNKWELWQSLYSNPLVQDQLPRTKLLDSVQSLKEMLTLYGSVYLKPINGSLGIGIGKLERTPKGYVFINRYKAKTFISNENKAWAFLKRMRKNKRYLIQQAVALTFQNKNVDFRVIMQKDGSQNWTCSGIIGRYGRDGRIYTNDVSSIALGKDTLQTIFQLNDQEATQKEEEIISICTKACKIIENKYGSFGDVGIDISVDPNLKVWILEVNSCHRHNVPFYLNENTQMHSRVLTRPFEYAKSLAGFPEDEVLRSEPNTPIQPSI